jgi:hypothetical protein
LFVHVLYGCKRLWHLTYITCLYIKPLIVPKSLHLSHFVCGVLWIIRMCFCVLVSTVRSSNRCVCICPCNRPVAILGPSSFRLVTSKSAVWLLDDRHHGYSLPCGGCDQGEADHLGQRRGSDRGRDQRECVGGEGYKAVPGDANDDAGGAGGSTYSTTKGTNAAIAIPCAAGGGSSSRQAAMHTAADAEAIETTPTSIGGPVSFFEDTAGDEADHWRSSPTVDRYDGHHGSA